MWTYRLRCYASFNNLIAFTHSFLRRLFSDLSIFKLYRRASSLSNIYVVYVFHAAGVCMAAWWSGVEMSEASISTSLYLMWQTAVGRAILPSACCIGADRPWPEEGQGEVRGTEGDGEANQGKEQAKKQKKANKQEEKECKIVKICYGTYLYSAFLV